MVYVIRVKYWKYPIQILHRFNIIMIMTGNKLKSILLQTFIDNGPWKKSLYTLPDCL